MPATAAPHAPDRFLLKFVVLSSLMGVSVGLAQVTTTLYALHLGAQGSLLGLVAAAPSIGILFVGLPMGLWVERWGPAPLFIGGSAAVGLLYALLPLAPGTLFLLAVITLIGFLMPARFVSLNTVFMAELARLGESRAGWFRGTHMAGMYLAGPLLAAAVVERAGHASSYWLISLLFALTVALAPAVLASPRARAMQQPIHPAPGARPSMAAALRTLLADKRAQRLALLELALQMLHAYYTFFIVVIAVDRLGLPVTRAGLLVALQGSAFVAALFLLGGPVARWGSRAIGGGACLVALASVLLGLAPSAGWLWPGALLLGLGLGMIQTRNVTRFARLSAELGRGRVAGLNSLVGPGGSLAGGLLGGTLGAWAGLQPVFLLFALLFAALGWRALTRGEPETAVPPL